MADRKKNIFISYRVQDTAGETGRLVDSLKQFFDEDQIFMDIDKLEPGADFTQVIEKSLESCDVMLAVIGPNWKGKKADGSIRIKDKEDWVRLELSTALKRDIRIVPVLVDGGTLPSEEELPEDLHPLIRRQAYEISNKRWKYDTDNLVEFLIKSLGITARVDPEHPKVPLMKNSKLRGCLYIGIGVLVVLILIGIFYPESKTTTTPAEKMVNPPPSVSASAATGYWSNAMEDFAFDVDQQGTTLYGSLYVMVKEKPVLVTNRGTGTINGSSVTLDFKVRDGKDTTFYKLDGIISSDGKHMRSTLTIEDNKGSDAKEMDLIKTIY